MRKNTLFISITSLFLLATTSAKADIPTIEELKDPYSLYGLHLDRIDMRQKALRKTGVGNDISTQIILYRKTKTFIKDLYDQSVTLKAKIHKTEGKTSPRKSTREKHKQEIIILNKELKDIEEKIKDNKNLQAIRTKKIMEVFNLDVIQVAKIPAK